MICYTDEWRRKPVAISTVSDGPFGGTQVITSPAVFTLEDTCMDRPCDVPGPEGY
ncbi:MAG: hypothetical protein MZV63_39240 [Marinilabiliales bacterium]|nr:hypothetical protein [Marinilabiliales bacterium]